MAAGGLLLDFLGSYPATVLAGIRPSDGSVAWQVPFDGALAPPGDLYIPAVAGDVVATIVPDPHIRSLATAEGIDATTGSVLWATPNVSAIAPPIPCLNQTAFCIPLSGQPMAELSATDGSQISTRSPPVTYAISSETFVWTDPESGAATLIRLAPDGSTSWTEPLPPQMGVGVSSENGYVLQTLDGNDVVSFGQSRTGYAGDTTTAFDPGTGQVRWSDPGALNCFGTFTLSSPIICRMTGNIATGIGAFPSFAGVTLTLEGFDPATGAITWSHQVNDPGSYLLWTGPLEVADGSHVIVRDPQGLHSLDVSDGTYGQPPATVWCITAGGSLEGQWTAFPVVDPCTSGNTLPLSAPSFYGQEIDGLFVWATPSGMEAARLPAT